MKFEIDSSKISYRQAGVKGFFALINEVCRKYGFTYFVIGAFARDIILENIFQEKAGVATKDIDIAIRLKSWEAYEVLVKELIDKHGFAKGRNVHEYLAPSGIVTDIVPFGGLEENRSVTFPGHSREINTMGFREVENAAIDISFDGEVNTKVASIESMVILKLFAWKDRRPASVSEKHVRDISLIIDAYYLSKIEEIVAEFSDLLDIKPFDDNKVSARAIGRRINRLCRGYSDLMDQLNEVLEIILSDTDNSLFIRQYTATSNYDFLYCYEIINELKEGLDDIAPANDS